MYKIQINLIQIPNLAHYYKGITATCLIDNFHRCRRITSIIMAPFRILDMD